MKHLVDLEALRNELFFAPMKNNYTFSRDELVDLLEQASKQDNIFTGALRPLGTNKGYGG